ncbi:HipA N-terminal domain-containing protein [bacterium]|nr:HipA N-terminal domain-containing protein [bacterium]
MRKCVVFQKNIQSGYLLEHQQNVQYEFQYLSGYQGDPISLAMPVRDEPYLFDRFPSFFDGLLPEGYQLAALLKRLKIDRDDPFSQLMAIGKDMVGSVTVEEV